MFRYYILFSSLSAVFHEFKAFAVFFALLSVFLLLLYY